MNIKHFLYFILIFLICIVSYISFLLYSGKYNNKNNKEDFLVSVLLPAYNVEEYIKECLDSIINQTYKNLEIIIVDDYSTDKTKELIKEYVKKDSRIKFLQNKQNLGLPATRNVALKEAKGEYFYFMDTDDFIDLDYIQSFVDVVKNTNADVVVANNLYLYYSNQKLNNLFPRKFNKKRFIHKKQYKKLIDNTVTGYYVWNKFVKSSLMREGNITFKEDVVFGEDQLFSFKILSSAKKIVWNDTKSFYYYRRRSDSLTSKNFAPNIKRLESLIKVIYEQYNYTKYNNYDSKSVINISDVIFYLNNIILLYKEPYINNAYKDIRKLFIDIQDLILENKDIYNEYIVNYFNKIIEYKDLKSFLNNKLSAKLTI